MLHNLNNLNRINLYRKDDQQVYYEQLVERDSLLYLIGFFQKTNKTIFCLKSAFPAL